MLCTVIGTLRNEYGKKDDGSREKYYFLFSFSLSTLLKILEQKKVKSSASKANKDGQFLFFDVHVVHRTPKVSFPRRISEDDGKKAASTLHSNVQLLFSLIKAIVLYRSRTVAVLVS